MDKILVGSVFSGTASWELNGLWYNLQLQMLEESLSGVAFEHVVSLSQGQSSAAMDRSIILYQDEQNSGASSTDHASHLHRLRDYFCERRNDFDAFLFLDSDAFPYRSGWLPKLLEVMRERKFELAAITRFENLTWYPHPSVCFCLSSSLDSLDWSVSKAEQFDGTVHNDPGVAMRHARWYPLIRTNRQNVHPLLCGIYARMFYHHSAGSRTSRVFRSHKYYQVGNLTDIWRKQLFEAPDEFLRQLDW